MAVLSAPQQLLHQAGEAQPELVPMPADDVVSEALAEMQSAAARRHQQHQAAGHTQQGSAQMASARRHPLLPRTGVRLLCYLSHLLF